MKGPGDYRKPLQPKAATRNPPVDQFLFRAASTDPCARRESPETFYAARRCWKDLGLSKSPVLGFLNTPLGVIL